MKNIILLFSSLFMLNFCILRQIPWSVCNAEDLRLQGEGGSHYILTSNHGICQRSNFYIPQGLAEHRWRHRVILLFAPATDHPALEKQLTLLTEHSSEVTDRNLVFYQIFPSGGQTPHGTSLSSDQAHAFYHDYQAPADQFSFLLIGKDGTEKLRRQTVVSLSELFALIDSMPMRRAEMKRKGK